MLFNTWQYFVFLAIVLSLYYCLGTRWQNRMLLAASYFFYSCWDWRFTTLLLISTGMDFWLALKIHQAEDIKRRKRLLLISILVNFGILGFFKYFNFFLGSTVHVLQWLGFQANVPILRIILPVGISFYTFQTMNYTIDVYRRQMEPTRDLVTFALFVSYFPHLVAGPIMRAEKLLPQLLNKRRVDNNFICTGGLLILVGLFKKVVIADSVAPEVERIFAAPSHFTSLMLLKGLYFFSFQIYCDFSGYSDIARGTSRLLGIELVENFNQPYLSRSVSEFWKRWHISLSTWLRDYVYIPMGGNREGRAKTYRNLLLTMLIGGLWHGANWTFVVWGGLHGLYLVIHKFILENRGRLRFWQGPPLPGAVKIFCTFHLVALAWIFFRARDFHTAFEYLNGILGWHGGVSMQPILATASFGILLWLIDAPQYVTRDHTAILTWPWWLRGVAYAAMVFLLVCARGGREIPFIYFQF